MRDLNTGENCKGMVGWRLRLGWLRWMGMGVRLSLLRYCAVFGNYFYHEGHEGHEEGF